MSSSKAAQETPWEKLGIATAPISAIHSMLDVLWGMQKKITLCLVGDTGIGKTPIVHQWVEKRGGYIRVLNFGHMSQEEISMAMFNENATEFDFVPPTWLTELNQRAAETGCAVLFLDEWNRGDKSLVNALFTLTDDRRIHNFHLHENVLVVAAMNPSDGTYLVNSAEKDHAIRKRLNFVAITPDLAGWLQYAREAGFHPLVIDFVRAASQHFYDAGTRDAGKAFPCPANWEKVSGILQSAESSNMPLTSSAVLALVSGQVGHTVATKFLEFVADNNTLIQPEEVLYSYQEKARKRVAALLGARLVNGEMVADQSKKIRADVLGVLAEGVAMTLYSEFPDPEMIAEGLGLYLSDLPADLFTSFTAEYMKKYASLSGSRGDAYTKRLSWHLMRNDAYKEAVVRIQTNKREISRAVRSQS